MTLWLLALHAAATLGMGGLAWFVQVVHYPLMASVPPEAFPEYERLHRRKTAWIVVPLMLAEATSAAWLLVDPPLASPPSGSPPAPHCWRSFGSPPSPFRSHCTSG